jgi:hypothetical protein
VAQVTTASALNGAVEVGLRTLTVLASIHPSLADMNELVAYDYLLIHSGDTPDGPPSLHPPSPLRAGEVAVTRVAHSEPRSATKSSLGSTSFQHSRS